MRYLTVWLLTLAALLGAYLSRAQSQDIFDPPRCPIVTVSCPDADLDTPLTFSASVSGPDPSIKITFKWAVSAGTIVTGQGTNSITVDTAEAGGRTVEARVEVGGFPVGFVHTASCSTAVIRDPLPGKVGEYGDVSITAERAPLDRLAAELRKDPHAQGYILSYAGRRTRVGEARWHAERAGRYLSRDAGIDRRRIVIVYAGYREAREIELYVVPGGSIALPVPAPTVDPKEVKIIGRRRRRPMSP